MKQHILAYILAALLALGLTHLLRTSLQAGSLSGVFGGLSPGKIERQARHFEASNYGHGGSGATYSRQVVTCADAKRPIT